MPRYGNMTDDPSYQALVEELAEKCTCTPESDRPCAGLLAGGLCDDLHMEREIIDEEDDTEPDDL
jgi:hypothetical protein